LILSASIDFRTSFLKECGTRDERHSFLRLHCFDPVLILSELKQFSLHYGSSGSSNFFDLLTRNSVSKSLSSVLSEYLSFNNHSFLLELLNLTLPFCDSSVFESGSQASSLSSIQVLDQPYVSVGCELDENFSSTKDMSNPSLDISCNICGSSEFTSFGVTPRLFAKCCVCGSLERHRALYYALDQLFLLNPLFKGIHRVLQLAPEQCTYDYMLNIYGSGYYVSDPSPVNYPYSNCLKLSFPADFYSFPSFYFNLIVHNHVLEHLSGTFVDHIDEFHRLLADDGYLVFTFPDLFYRFGLNSVEGGEFLPSDVQRIRLFGQCDHLKWLGVDFVSYLYSKFSSVHIFCDPRTSDGHFLMATHNAVGLVFACRK
jgi:phosphoglycolate phosphatase